MDTRSGGNGKSDRKEMRERAQKEFDAEEFPVFFLRPQDFAAKVRMFEKESKTMFLR